MYLEYFRNYLVYIKLLRILKNETILCSEVIWPRKSHEMCCCNKNRKKKEKQRRKQVENSASYAVFSTHHKVLVDLKPPNNLGVPNRMKREKINIPYFKMNIFFWLLTILSVKAMNVTNIYSCLNARASPCRLKPFHIGSDTIVHTTYRGLFVNWLYDKLFVVKRDVSYFTPRKTNLGCQPSKRKSSH